MASILFSTVGQALGGPLAGVAGALAGQGADALLFGRRRRDLQPMARFGTSAYGEPIPRVYGTIRQAGLLIWASPVRTESGGKGRQADRRAKHMSMAFALSSRPVRAVHRIWADGAEFRDRDGRFATPTVMRVWTGGADQPLDPAIAAEEGLDGAPAYRRLAYVVFEHLSLAPFGNRVPSFSFEVEADPPGEGGVNDVGRWLRDLAAEAGLVADADPLEAPLHGFAAAAADWREAVETLAEIASVRFDDQREVPCFVRAGAQVALSRADLVRTGDGGGRGRRHLGLSDRSGARIACRSITYLDVERDYLPGTQTAYAGDGTVELRSAYPVAAFAGPMLGLARRLLAEANASGETVDIGLSWRWLGLRPGDRLRLPDAASEWDVTRIRIAPMMLVVACRRCGAARAGAPGPSDPGRVQRAPVVPVPATVLLATELPHLPGRAASPALTVVATGPPGWRGATVEWAPPGSSTPAVVGEAVRVLPHGHLAAALPAGPAGIWDEAGELVLETADPGFELLDQPRLEVLLGRTLLLVGDELLGFRTAIREGATRWRLRGLLRGQHFTRASTHGAGTAWVGIDPAAVVDLPFDLAWAGGELALWAAGPGDGTVPAMTSRMLDGRSAAPLPPAHVRVEAAEGPSIRIAWIPRARTLADWSAETGGSLPPCLVRLRDADAPAAGPMAVRVEGTEVLLGRDMVRAALGAGLARLLVEVEVLGPGPAAYRTSGPVTFLLDPS
ncbi:GTA baseplate fiber-binding domain-containing protein [Thermaurantiacus sp.]